MHSAGFRGRQQSQQSVKTGGSLAWLSASPLQSSVLQPTVTTSLVVKILSTACTGVWLLVQLLESGMPVHTLQHAAELPRASILPQQVS